MNDQEYRNKYYAELKKDPIKYRQYLDNMKVYLKKRRQDSEKGAAMRDYHRQYIKEYRKNNINNINEKEKEYHKWYQANIKYSRQSMLENKVIRLQRQIDNLKKQLNNEKRLKIKYKTKYRELRERK